ncbi:hypothetical protein D0Z07_8380 [Hyphodiscus hymeniophilus]|uniref:Uncharacterized protein n=1 Tax=Hyphodiscus hymeniophilus TaxID=353542 RepID=A0A9P6SQ10_9HELO|nr:hypothetical protein D0Z07_8380 [Hyphodiscus hymeniophilus]
MAPTPVALPPALPSELLEYVLARQAYPTTLLICQSRSVFLSLLLKAVKHKSPVSRLPNPELDVLSKHVSSEGQAQRHSLLVPTLHQVATSKFINLVFIPTVTHLRAYMTVFPGPQNKEGPPRQEWDKQGNKVPLLVVFGVVALHRDTSEWSAQGLGNSLSGCVQAGWRSGRKVVVLEERQVEDGNENENESGEFEEERPGDEGAETETEGGCKIWEERVPMLNGSVRRAGLESEEGGWSGRTVEVGRILARWFKFRKSGRENEDTA